MPRASRKRLKLDPDEPDVAGSEEKEIATALETSPPPDGTDAAGTPAAEEDTDAGAPDCGKRKSPYTKNKGTPKRKAWSLAEKKELCRQFRDSDITSQAKFLREYNERRDDCDQISSSNFHHWWKECQRGAIRLDDLSTDTDDRVKRRRGAKFMTVEMKLAEYVEEYDKIRGEGDPALTGPALLRKAKEFAEELGDTTFQGSKGWLWNFRRRNGLQKYLSQIDGQKQETLERVVTPGQVRDALSTLSTFAAQSGNQGLAVDVARLHQKLARLQHLTRTSI